MTWQYIYYILWYDDKTQALKIKPTHTFVKFIVIEIARACVRIAAAIAIIPIRDNRQKKVYIFKRTEWQSESATKNVRVILRADGPRGKNKYNKNQLKTEILLKEIHRPPPFKKKLKKKKPLACVYVSLLPRARQGRHNGAGRCARSCWHTPRACDPTSRPLDGRRRHSCRCACVCAPALSAHKTIAVDYRCRYCGP